MSLAAAPLPDQPSPMEREREADWDRLAAALQACGIRHVAPHGTPVEPLPSDPAALLLALARSPHVRLQEAMIAYLLTYPEQYAAAWRAIAQLDGPLRDRAMRRYVAACCLQRMWRTRLRLDLGEQPLLPPAYLDELGLPPLDLDFGRATLRHLAAQEEERYGYDAWAGYTSLMDLLLAEIGGREWGRPDAPAG